MIRIFKDLTKNVRLVLYRTLSDCLEQVPRCDFLAQYLRFRHGARLKELLAHAPDPACCSRRAIEALVNAIAILAGNTENIGSAVNLQASCERLSSGLTPVLGS